MFEIMNQDASNYLLNLIPKLQPFIKARNSQIPTFHCQTDCFKYSFPPSTLNSWFNLDDRIRNLESILIFKSRLLLFVRAVQRKYYNLFDPAGLKFLIRLCLGFSHLNFLVAWRLKILYITICTATTFDSFAMIL